MSDHKDRPTSQQDIERLRQEIEETYRGVLELVYEIGEPGGLDEVKRLRDEVRKLSTELEETYRGVIELATTLENDEQRIRSLTECAGLGLWYWTVTSDALTVNQEWLDIIGLSAAGFGGTLAEWDRRVHPDDLPSVQEERHRLLNGERPFLHAEFRIETAANVWQWVLCSARVMGARPGEQARQVSGTLLNIHARKQTELKIQTLNLELEARNQERMREIEHINHQLLDEVRRRQHTEQALRQSNLQAETAHQEISLLTDRLSLALGAARMGIWDWDIINDIVYWDDKMHALYGLIPDGQTKSSRIWETSVHPDDLPTIFADSQKAILDNTDFDSEFRVIWPDRSVHTLKTNGMIQRDENGQAIRMIGLNYDITHHKQREQELREAKQTAESANQAKSLFLANMSHELRTPLQAILGFSQLMQLDTDLSDKQRNNLLIINRSGNHLHELIHDVLEVSEIEAGRVETRPSDFDLHNLVEQIQAMFHLKIERKNIGLTISLDEQVPQYISGDAVKLRQILINLLGNAVKFTDDGEVSLKIAVSSQPGQLQFEISDTGPGIHAAELQRLFQPFEQGLAGLTKGGTGLGLVITRQYVQLLGGELSVTSTPGEGSRFTFTYPYKTSHPYKARKPAAHKSVTGLRSGNGSRRALVVDDHPQSLDFMVQLLEKLGFHTLQAVDGKQALDEFKLNQPDIILIDLLLPIMDGYQVIKQIRQTDNGETIPIIAVTAGASTQNVRQAYRCGVNGLLRKPCKLPDVIQLLEDMPNIDFAYADEPVLQAATYPPKMTPGVLAVLPEPLRLKLRSATESGDIRQLRECLSDVEQTDHALAMDLARLVDRYEYDRLLEILN